MKKQALIICLIFNFAIFNSEIAVAEKTIQLATINWEPYTGENLPSHGFFSEIVTKSFSRVGYRVKFKYYPWSRALKYAKEGYVHGVMAAYQKKDRLQHLSYPNIVWKVREEFITLRGNAITYTGALNSLKGYTVGVLRGSAQAEELKAAGIHTEEINNHGQSVAILLRKRIDAVLIPKRLFFYHLGLIDPKFDRTRIKILKPHFKIYDMYVAFSKQKSSYEQITADFNKGLKLIINDGTYENILNKHEISLEE